MLVEVDMRVVCAGVNTILKGGGLSASGAQTSPPLNDKVISNSNDTERNEPCNDFLRRVCPPCCCRHTMNFAPYQDESPEVERAFSPTPADPHRTKSPTVGSPRGSPPIPGFSSNGLPSPSHFAGSGHVATSGHGNTGFGPDVEGGRWNMGAFETSLPIRMDFEAMLAYLLLPPAGGVFLLLVEHKSDYVRYVGGYWAANPVVELPVCSLY